MEEPLSSSSESNWAGMEGKWAMGKVKFSIPEHCYVSLKYHTTELFVPEALKSSFTGIIFQIKIFHGEGIKLPQLQLNVARISFHTHSCN